MTIKGVKMKQKSQTRQTGATKAIKEMRRATRKQYSAAEKYLIGNGPIGAIWADAAQ
jgi:hypothetical protein